MKNTTTNNTTTTATADILTDITTATATAVISAITDNNKTTADLQNERQSAVKINGQKIPYFNHTYTTKNNNTYTLQCIWYYSTNKTLNQYFWLLHCIKVVSKVIHTRVKAMNMNGYNIPKFLSALKICSAVYVSLLMHYDDIINNNTYNNKTYLSIVIDNTFTLFSAFDGMLVDLLEIALEYIPQNEIDVTKIGDYSILAKEKINQHLTIVAKHEKQISIDNVGCDNDGSIATEKTLEKIAFEKWLDTTINSNSNATATADITTTTADITTAKQLEILTDYSITHNTQKTADNFNITRQGCEKHLKLIRTKFKTKATADNKRYIAAHYRLIEYVKHYDDKMISAYRSIYTVRKDKNNNRYISIPHLTKISF